MSVMHIREPNVIRRPQLGEIQTAWLISITWLNVQFLPGAWDLVSSDAELQFDLNILRAGLIPADSNLRSSKPHKAALERSKARRLKWSLICHVSSNNRRGLQYPDNLIYIL